LFGLVLVVAGCTKKVAEPTPTAPGAASGPRELRVFTWSSYLIPEVIAQFEKENNVKVITDYFSSNEELLAKVSAQIQSGSKGFDVIFPSDYMVSHMTKLEHLQPLDHRKLPVLEDFDSAFKKPEYDPELKFAIPFDWGTTGIAVNSKLVKDVDLAKGLSWKDILSNPKYAKKVTTLDDAKENVHAALLALGKKWSTATEADIKEAFAFLKKNKKQVKLYTAEARPALENGDCGLCMIFSGDALQVMKENPKIGYFIPTEGATIWSDTMAIPKNASEVGLAHAFMNKMLQAESAKQFTENSFYLSPNSKANALLSDGLKKNLSLFPSEATRAKLAYLTDRPELLTIVDKLWTELRAE